MSTDSPNKGYWIGGVKVQFPGKPYPSQFIMMTKLEKLAANIPEVKFEEMEQQNPIKNETKIEVVDLTCVVEKKRTLSQDSDDFQPQKRLRIPDSNLDVKDLTKSPYFTPEKIPVPNINEKVEVTSCCSGHSTVSNEKIRYNNLSLLCNQEVGKTDKWLLDPEKLRGVGDLGTTKKFLETKIPTIFFGTRTHKQISQIIRELKKTKYKDVRMTILSSRERACIHPQVSRSKNKNEECAELLDSCSYHTNRRMSNASITSLPGFAEAWDIEDLVRLGKKKKKFFSTYDRFVNFPSTSKPQNLFRIIKSSMHGIWYFHAIIFRLSALALSTSGILIRTISPIIAPGNIDINLAGNIIIIDEAHNIEDSARSAASYVVTSEQLKSILDDFENLDRIGSRSSAHDYFMKKVSELNQLINRYSDKLDEYNSFTQQGKSWLGHELVAMLIDIGLGPENYDSYKGWISKLNEEKEKSKSQEFGEISVPTVSSATLVILKGLALSFHFLFKDNMKFVDDYRSSIFIDRVAILRTLAKTPDSDSFSELKDNVHALILTSGTLSPMVSFQSELGMPFHIQLEANHVIKDSQAWVGTVSHGPRGSLLNGTFKNSETFIFQDDVGDLILKVCGIIPYGVLCFLPSYGMMEKLIHRWEVKNWTVQEDDCSVYEKATDEKLLQNVLEEPWRKKPTLEPTPIPTVTVTETTGLWDKLQSQKHLFAEPKAARPEEFDELINKYYDVISNSDTTDTEDEQNGAIFFAVCRGKISEGLDFADNNARAVITNAHLQISLASLSSRKKMAYRRVNRIAVTGHYACQKLHRPRQWINFGPKLLNRAIAFKL
ncbi:Fanconi anemia group J [Nymphon striatum]|nr:Fanconi anemia group J [Nymphon striatum]